ISKKYHKALHINKDARSFTHGAYRIATLKNTLMQMKLHAQKEKIWQEYALNIQYFIWGTQYMIYMHYLSPVEKTKFGWLPSSTESTQQHNKTTYQEGWNTNNMIKFEQQKNHNFKRDK
ncbi:hypothetical protein ACJX0J_017335, partial [Zea mays]